MTKIKLCGLSRPEDIRTANALRPDYIGFVFAPGSRRRVSPERAAALKALLKPGIPAVGVFVDDDPEQIAALLNAGIIDLAQLHGNENEEGLRALRRLTDRPIIQAFRVKGRADILAAQRSTAEHILLDAGAGDGRRFDWTLLRQVERPYFLAGGLDPENVGPAVAALRPWAVDVSSGIETDGVKDGKKMNAFVNAVRNETGKEEAR